MTRLERQLRAELRALGAPCLATLSEDVFGTQEATSALAARLSDLPWLEGAVKTLEPAGRLGLRLLSRAPVTDSDLNALARLLTNDPTNADAQLTAAGLVWQRRQHVGPRPRRTLGVLDSLRRPLAGLALEPERDEPQAPTPDEEAFAWQRLSFVTGATLAAVASIRPRATRLGELHAFDAKPLGRALGPLAGGAAGALALVKELVHAGVVTQRDQRFEVDDDRLRDAPATLLLHRLAAALHDPRLAAGLGLLLLRPGWTQVREVCEAIALIAVEHATGFEPLDTVVEQCWKRLETSTALIQRTQDGVEWCRLSVRAREVLETGRDGSPAAQGTLLVQPHLQIVASQDTPVEVLVAIGRFCRFDDADQVARLQLDPASVKAAATRGVKAEDVVGLLETHARHGVPATVRRALTDWLRTTHDAKVLTGTVLLTDAGDEDVQRASPELQARLVLPGVWLAAPGHAGALVDALRHAGWSVTAHVESDPGRDNVWAVEAMDLAAQAEKLADCARRALLATRP